MERLNIQPIVLAQPIEPCCRVCSRKYRCQGLTDSIYIVRLNFVAFIFVLGQFKHSACMYVIVSFSA